MPHSPRLHDGSAEEHDDRRVGTFTVPGKNLTVWVVGTLGSTDHPTHAHVDKALSWIERVGPKRAFLTHMSNRLDYASLCRTLPAHVRPAHDGFVLEID